MQIKARITFNYETEKQTEVALKSLNPDNSEPIKTETDGNRLIYHLSGDSLNSFLATVDDLLFCEIMVEKVLELEK